jgi:predicted TIM-barrel fold metal-dependent hydrolase
MIIDFRVNPPTRKGQVRFTSPTPKRLLRYRDVYGDKSFELPEEKVIMEPDRFIELMDQAGVDKVLFVAGDIETTYGSVYPNSELAELIDHRPDRFLGLAGADPHKGVWAAREFEKAVRDYGFVGLNLAPWEHKILSNDKKYYPLYEKCVELDVPVILHTSINFSRELKLDAGNPMHLDEVAIDFPDLKIVASHAGWPWVLQMVAVAWRHPTVYMDLAGIRARHLDKRGSGWEPLLNYGNNVLRDRVLFASDWPMLEWRSAVEELRALPLKPEVIDAWLGGNAARLLKLTD